MLVELGVVEQRYQAVLEVISQAATVSEVAVRFGVTRQTVHRWLRRYAAEGLAGLADGSARPLSCPHQMPPVVEARIVELRLLSPSWGRGRSGSGWRRSGCRRCRVVRRSIGVWCVTV